MLHVQFNIVRSLIDLSLRHTPNYDVDDKSSNIRPSVVIPLITQYLQLIISLFEVFCNIEVSVIILLDFLILDLFIIRG